MATEPRNVATAADQLIELVEQRKEISIKEAAKALNTDASTIEAWSNFFEEDGVLAIKYKFTTPYLIIPEDAKPRKKEKKTQDTTKIFQQSVQEVELNTLLKEAGNLIDSARDTHSQGQFGLLSGIYQNMFNKAKRVVDYLSTKDLTPQQKNELLNKLRELETLMKHSEQLVVNHKYDEAQIAYASLEQKARDLVSNVSHHYESTSKEGPHDLKELMDTTYVLMQEGKIEEARDNYAKIKGMFIDEAHQEVIEQHETRNDILRLNRDISANTLKIYRNRMNEDEKRIKFIAKKCDKAIAKRNFTLAAAGYKEMKEIFDGLPPGFKKDKLKLQGEILKVYEKLAKKREQQLTSQFQKMEKEILTYTKATEQELSKNDLAAAQQHYNKLSTLFQNLPPGFMNEKYKLQTQVMPLYNILAQRLKSSSEQKLLSSTNRIHSIISDMDSAINGKSWDLAHANYSHINKAFKEIPEGFIRQKIDLQDRIIDVYEKLLIHQFSSNEKDYKHSVQSIDQMIQLAHNSLKSGNYIKANAIYRRLKRAYVDLPEVDLVTKQQLRTKILHVYKQILSQKQEVRPHVPDLPQPQIVDSLDAQAPPRVNLAKLTTVATNSGQMLVAHKAPPNTALPTATLTPKPAPTTKSAPQTPTPPKTLPIPPPPKPIIPTPHPKDSTRAPLAPNPKTASVPPTLKAPAKNIALPTVPQQTPAIPPPPAKTASLPPHRQNPIQAPGPNKQLPPFTTQELPQIKAIGSLNNEAVPSQLERNMSQLKQQSKAKVTPLHDGRRN